MSVGKFVKDLKADQSYFLQLAKNFPYPMQIYLPDGMLAVANSAFLREFNIPFASLIEGRYNILYDPTLIEHGVLDQVYLAFSGYPAEVMDIPAPVHSFKRFFHIPNAEFELYYLDIKAVPIKDATDSLICVVITYLTRRKYVEREEISLAKDYIEQHWVEDFDLAKVASAALLSKFHFSRLFKKHTGITPYHYYSIVKVEKLKQALLNKNLTVEQAFGSCGIQYHSYYATMFKKLTGLSPTEYRNIVHKQNKQYPD